MEILKLNPSFKDYIWGGTRLREEWGKNCDFDRVAESWEVSCHPNGASTIEGTGETLADYLKRNPAAMGTKHQGEFPILIKLIDACDNLSVQVHPDDKAAAQMENAQGKTEMWYVVDALPGASLIYGVEREVTQEELARRIQDGTLMEVLHTEEVHPGDVFFIPAGTLHGIGKGCLIAEIQQNSDITYRVFDYNRKGADGKPRELHVEKALKVSSLTPTPRPQKVGEVLADCPYFKVVKKEITAPTQLTATDQSFLALLCIEGSGTVGDKTAHKGDAFFIPAGEGTIPVDGNMTLLVTEC